MTSNQYIIAIDIGKGTEDIMIWDQKSNLENSIQLILPSMTNLMEINVRKCYEKEPDAMFLFNGNIMAGEPWHKIIYEKAEKYPNTIIMREKSAWSLKYNNNFLINKGIKIVEDEVYKEIKKNTTKYYEFITSDINWKRINLILQSSGIELHQIKKVLLCCQDHGNSLGKTSSRDFRMKNIYNKSIKSGKLQDLLVTKKEISTSFPRYNAILDDTLKFMNHLQMEDILLMDSSPAVLYGAYDEKDGLLVNVGNGHTVMALFENEEISFLYEMHTGGLNDKQLKSELKELLEGSLTHEKSIARGGHGVFYRKKTNLQLDELLPIRVIGPNRTKLKNFPINLVHPAGAMMMAGPIGLIKAYYHKFLNKRIHYSL